MSDQIKAPITGNVKWTAGTGAQVAAGDPVVVVEVRGREAPAVAPRAGTVEEIRVRVGEPVQEGDVVAVLA